MSEQKPLSKQELLDAVAEVQTVCPHDQGFSGINISCTLCGRPKLSVLNDTIETQQATIAQQEKDIARMRSGIIKEAACIVSTRFEIGERMSDPEADHLQEKFAKCAIRLRELSKHPEPSAAEGK